MICQEFILKIQEFALFTSCLFNITLQNNWGIRKTNNSESNFEIRISHISPGLITDFLMKVLIARFITSSDEKCPCNWQPCFPPLAPTTRPVIMKIGGGVRMILPVPDGRSHTPGSPYLHPFYNGTEYK